MVKSCGIYFIYFYFLFKQNVLSEKSQECPSNPVNVEMLEHMAKEIVPELIQGKSKGEAGKVGVIGGSTEYTGAPYFAAISALKVGADLAYVLTTESASPVIKSYSPDLIVYPYLNIKSTSKISSIIPKLDVVVLGPGLGREEEAMSLTEAIIMTCKNLGKALIIDADGLYAISKNPAILKDYPSPGVIMTPNLREANKLKEAISRNDSNWYNYWGDYVSVLVKGESDQFFSSISSYDWSSSQGGTGRRAAGQGDILSGSLGTVFNWAYKHLNGCDHREQLAQSVASYAVAKFTRTCNVKAFELFGRSMTASDMVGQIHKAFEDVFGEDSIKNS